MSEPTKPTTGKNNWKLDQPKDSNKNITVHEKIRDRFQKELLAFIEKQQKAGSALPSNQDELIGLFLAEYNTQSPLYKEYVSYLLTISNKSALDQITLEDLSSLPIAKNWRLHDFLTQRHTTHLEQSKQETVFWVWNNHYSAAIKNTGNKELEDKRKKICKHHFWSDKINKLIKNNTLLSTLQKLFDQLFKEIDDITTQQSLAAYLQDSDHRPTLGSYLKAFEKAWLNLKDLSIKEALLKDTWGKRWVRKTAGVKSLDAFLVHMTQTSLLEQGFLVSQKKQELISELDRTFSHTQMSAGIFSEFPWDTYITSKPFAALSEKHEQQLRLATNEDETEAIERAYQRQLMQWYLERAHSMVRTQQKTTSKSKLLEQLASLSKLDGALFAAQISALKTTLSNYLQEYYLEEQVNHDLIKAQFDTCGIDQKHFPAYLTFWKQVYDLDSKQATFVVDGREMIMNFTDKKLLTHPDKFSSSDNLDTLFSFERTIDFKNSDPLFGKLFWNTPQTYILDDITGEIIDTVQQNNDLAIYVDDLALKNRILFDKKTLLTITDPHTWKKFTWYPEQKDLNEDKEIPNGNHMEIEHNDVLILVDEQGNQIPHSPNIPLTTSTNEKHDTQFILTNEMITTYQINLPQTRTFSLPAIPPIITQLMQTALFNEMATKNKFPTREIEEQQSVLSPNKPKVNATMPLVSSYAETVWDEDEDKQGYTLSDDYGDAPESVHYTPQDSEKQLNHEKYTSYKFAATSEIPLTLIQDTAKRFPRMLPNALPFQIKAWIDAGEIFFHTAYFCKKHDLADISNENGKLIFTLNDKQKTQVDITQISKIKSHENILACIAELNAAKRHEIAHRLLEFHGLDKLTYTTDDDITLLLDQETLCEIADGVTIPWRKDLKKNKRFVKINWHRVRLDTLEQKIAEKIEWFTRKSVKRLDAQHLNEYITDYQKFTNLIAANTAAGTLPDPDLDNTRSTRKALLSKLQQYIKNLDKGFDMTNPDHITQRTQAEQHLQTLKDQETKLSATPPPDGTELQTMRNEHIALGQFLQPTPTASPTQEQPTGENPEDHTQDPNHQEQEDEEQDTQRETFMSPEAFDSGFSSLGSSWSDNNVKPVPWTTLFLKESISTIPGHGYNRVKYVITPSNDPQHITLTLEDASEKNVKTKTVVEMTKNQATLDALKKAGKYQLYLFSQQTKKDWFSQMASKFLWGERATISGDLKRTYQEKGESKTAPITHVGIIKEKVTEAEKTEHLVFKIEPWISTVKVSGNVPWSWGAKELRTKTMDYDTFALFCKTKQLHPLTEDEVKRAWQKTDPAKVAQEDIPRTDKLMSLRSVRKWLKAIPETYMKKREEDKEFEFTLAQDYLSRFLPNTSLFYLDEIKNDLSGTDGAVRQRIQKYKAAWSWGWDKSDVHDKPISAWIRDAIFKNPKNTRKYKYQAASALLYALEKGSAYFRELAPYANKDGGGYWIKCILGDEAHAKFKKDRQKMIDQIKSGGMDSAERAKLQDKLVKFELEFIQEATTDKVFWWSKFWREIEDHKHNLYGGADSIDPSGVAKQGNFKYMFNTFMWGWISWNSPKTTFSALKAMEAAVETNDDFSMFYMCVLMLFANGMVHMLPNDYLDRISGIWRSRGIPVALFAGDPYASGKVVRILDHIARKAGKQPFSEFAKKDISFFDNRNVSNYAEETHKNDDWDPVYARKDLSGKFNSWWEDTGEIITNAFNYKNEYLIDVENTHRKTTAVINEYLWDSGVFNGYKWVQGDDYVRNIDGQSPFWSNNLLNLSKWSFSSMMMQWLWSNQQVSEHTISLRHNLSDSLDSFETSLQTVDHPASKKTMVQLLYKKFIQYFENYFTERVSITSDQTYKDVFDAAIQGNWSLDQLIRKRVFREKTRRNKQDASFEDEIYQEAISVPVAKSAILKFADLIKSWMADLSADDRADIIPPAVHSDQQETPVIPLQQRRQQAA